MSTSEAVLENAHRGVERAKGGCGEEDGLSGRGRRAGRVATRCCIRAHIYCFIQVHAYNMSSIYIHIKIYTCRCIYLYMNIYTHVYIYTYTHVYIYIYIYIHVYMYNIM